MKPEYLERPVLFHICKDGTVTYRLPPEPIFNGIALPFFSVDTLAEAKTLRLLLCKAQYEPHPDLPGQVWYVYPGFGGELEDIPAVADAFANWYQKMKEQQP